MRAECERIGRNPAELEYTSGGARTVEQAKWYAEAGVHRITVPVRGRTGAEARDELMRFGDEVIAKTQDVVPA